MTEGVPSVAVSTAVAVDCSQFMPCINGLQCQTVTEGMLRMARLRMRAIVAL